MHALQATWQVSTHACDGTFPQEVATWLDSAVGADHPGIIAAVIGAASALVDNVPLVAATQGMYTLDQVRSVACFDIGRLGLLGVALLAHHHSVHAPLHMSLLVFTPSLVSLHVAAPHGLPAVAAHCLCCGDGWLHAHHWVSIGCGLHGPGASFFHVVLSESDTMVSAGLCTGTPGCVFVLASRGEG